MAVLGDTVRREGVPGAVGRWPRGGDRSHLAVERFTHCSSIVPRYQLARHKQMIEKTAGVQTSLWILQFS